MHTALLSLKIDFAFKTFFVTRPELLLNYLNALFAELGHIPIKSIEIKNPELFRNRIDGKTAILDIVAKDDRNRRFNIEMQTKSEADFIQRTSFYAYNLYVAGIKKGQKHGELAPVYSINILDFILFPGDDFHNCFRVNNIKKPFHVMSKDMEFNYVELGKVALEVNQLKTPLEQWAFYIRSAHMLTEEEMQELQILNSVFIEAHELLEQLSMDEPTLAAYRKREAEIFFQETGARKNRAEAEAIGLARGLAEGKVEMAIKMKAEGAEPDFIRKVTGLTEEEIRNLIVGPKP